MPLSLAKSVETKKPTRTDHAALIRTLLLVAILAAFGRTMFNDFVDWDDGRLIYFNPNISKVDLEVPNDPDKRLITYPTLQGLLRQWNFHDAHTNEMYNPLVFTLWWGLGQLAQLRTPDMLDSWMNPQVYHGANLIVHWLSACIVFEILRRLNLGQWPSAVGALLFALHPMQTEAVAWATAMKDLLSGFFAMATIWRYLVAVQSTGRRQRNNRIAWGLLYIAAMLAKPSTVVLPLIVAAIDLIGFGRDWKTVARWTAPWLLAAIPIIAIAEHVQPIPKSFGAPLWARPMIAGDALAFYMYKLALPLHLCMDYGRSPSALLHQADLGYPLRWTWIVPLAAALVLWRIRKKELTLAAAVFVLTVLPVLGFTPFAFQYYSTVADRFVYCGMLGVAIAGAYLLSRTTHRAVWIAALLLAGTWGGLSFAQAGVWQDTESLYQQAAGSVTQGSALHHAIYGQYKDRLAHAALRTYRQTLDPVQAKNALHDWYTLIDQAIDHYTISMQKDPSDLLIYDQLSRALAARGRYKDAIDVVQKWVEQQDKQPPAFREKPENVHYILGSLYAKCGQYDQAVKELELSLSFKSDPDVAKYLEQVKLKLAQQPPATAPSAPPASAAPMPAS